MGHITDRTAPPDVPTTNALAYIEDPDIPPPGEKAELYLSGAHVATLENAPGGGGRMYLMVEIEVVEVGTRFNDGGDSIVPIRRCRRVGDMWRPGEPKPEPKPKKKTKADEDAEAEAAAAENQPPLYDDEGPVDGATYGADGDSTDPEDDDEYRDEPEKLGDVLDEVDRPPFSHGGE